MINSAKARRNYEVQKSRAKRQISYQQNRNPLADSFEFDAACDPRHAAFMRNKAVKATTNTTQTIDAANTINPFVWIKHIFNNL